MGDVMKRRAVDSKGRIPDIEKNLVPRLEDLRNTVENVDKFPGLIPGMLLTTSWDGFTIGYKVTEKLDGMYLRTIKIRCDEARINEIPDDERAAIFNTLFEVFLDRASPAKILNKGPSIRWIEQVFFPTLLVKRDTAKSHIAFNEDHVRDGFLIN